MLVTMLCAALVNGQPHADTLADDRKRSISVSPAARRVVSLAPHATDLLMALGAAERLIAVDPHSDAPGLPPGLARIAAYPQADPERLLAVAPDLVLVWGEGLSPTLLARLEQVGLRVFVTQPRTLEDVAQSLERLGSLLGLAERGRDEADRFRARRDTIALRYASRPTIPVFVQIWELPLITIGQATVMADAMTRCAVTNAAASLAGASPRVSPEAVIALSPSLILSTVRQSNEARWRRLGVVGDAPGAARFVAFHDPALERPSPPILDSLERLCALIDSHRPVRAPALPGR
ncbi:MAG: helical backbone metal receptor [Betaproteobacteria bacterium]